MRLLGVALLLALAMPIFSTDMSSSGSWRRRSEKIASNSNNFYETVSRLISENDVAGLANYLNQNHQRNVKKALNQNIKRQLPILHQVLTKKNIPLSIYRKLLDLGADPNLAIDYFWKRGLGENCLFPGYTPAHVAVRMRQPEAVLALLKEFGANFLQPDQSDNDGGWTPIKLAKEKDNQEAIEFFRKKGFPVDDLVGQIRLETSSPVDVDAWVRDYHKQDEEETWRITMCGCQLFTSAIAGVLFFYWVAHGCIENRQV